MHWFSSDRYQSEKRGLKGNSVEIGGCSRNCKHRNCLSYYFCHCPNELGGKAKTSDVSQETCQYTNYFSASGKSDCDSCAYAVSCIHRSTRLIFSLYSVFYSLTLFQS
jgi:hypothetical protein